MTDENGSPENTDQPPELLLTGNQIVAWNLAWYRRAAGMTQDQLGKIIGWKKSAVSDAERSVSGQWTREFDAHALLILAAALDIPVGALLLPPPDDGTTAVYSIEIPGEDGCPEILGGADLLALVLPENGMDAPAMTAYRDRLRTAAARYLDPYWQENVDRWLTEATPPELRADYVARLRMDGDQAQAHADEFRRMADAVEKAGGG